MAFCNSYAQTNIQLFTQLEREGYSKEDRQRVFEAYEFAIRIFSALFLPSGKPFIDHLVGTASILASLRMRVEIVAAGLIHAAYLHGDFGSFNAGAGRGTRERVKTVVGKDTEEYIIRYHRLVWNTGQILALHNAIDELSPSERDVLLMRLANELEHHLDYGTLYFARNEEERRGHQRYIERHGPLMVTMAEKLGYPNLAADLKSVFAAICCAKISTIPFNCTHQMVAYLIPPRSFRVRFGRLCQASLDRFLSDGKRRFFKYFRLVAERLRNRSIRPA